tara:strand:- start:104 stop:508 length:405 start_codon:yes stop_codon:yes gene_type:complete
MELSMKHEQKNPADICNNVVMDVHSKLDRGVFTTKVAKKESIDICNRAYDQLRKLIENQILSIPFNIRNPKKPTTLSTIIDEMYWELPGYVHQWRQMHTNLYKDSFENIVDRIEFLADFKQDVKDTVVEKGGEQ